MASLWLAAPRSATHRRALACLVSSTPDTPAQVICLAWGSRQSLQVEKPREVVSAPDPPRCALPTPPGRQPPMAHGTARPLLRRGALETRHGMKMVSERPARHAVGVLVVRQHAVSERSGCRQPISAARQKCETSAVHKCVSAILTVLSSNGHKQRKRGAKSLAQGTRCISLQCFMVLA